MTSIQLPYRLLQEALVTWLVGLNPRHLPVNLPLVAAYMAGLLWTRGRATCTAIARGGAVSHDALNRLLKGDGLRGMLQVAALTLVERSGGYLIIDDVVWGKRGPSIPGVSKLYASALGRYVLGLNVVVLAWTDGRGLVIPLTFRFWKRPGWRQGKHRSYFAFDGSPFKTKLSLAVEMLEWAHQRGFQPTAVLFDSYYLAAPVLRYLQKRRWHWVTRLKTNRVLIVGGRKMKPSQWEAEAAEGRVASLNRSLVAHLAGWGTVRVTANRLKADGTVRFLAASNTNWGRGRIEAIYGHRWAIEYAVFRDGKQLAGLEDCQARSWQAQENHFALVLLAKVFVAHQARRSDSAGDVIHRISDRQVVLARAPVPAKVRQVRPHRLARDEERHQARRSANFA